MRAIHLLPQLGKVFLYPILCISCKYQGLEEGIPTLHPRFFFTKISHPAIFFIAFPNLSSVSKDKDIK